MYEIRIKDERIPAYRVIKGQFRQDAEAKAAAQRALWEARWKRMQASQLQKNLLVHGRQEAVSLTEQARAAIADLENLLLNGCKERPCTWESLKDAEPFRGPVPAAPVPLKQPTEPAKWVGEQIPEPPIVAAPEFEEPNWTLMQKLVPGLKKAKMREAEAKHEQAKRFADRKRADAQAHHDTLQKRQLDGQTAYDQAFAAYVKERHRVEDITTRAKADYTLRVNEWQQKKAAYMKAQGDQHAFIDRLAASYSEGSSEAIEYLTSEALTRSSLPETFP